MEDQELVEAFERAELPGGAFTHVDHVRVAWWYLRRYGFDEARQRLREALRRFAAAKGKAERYHETMTVAYLLIIEDRRRPAAALTWPEFAARNPELIARAPSVLSRYYTDGLLQSERARREFVMGDISPLPTPVANSSAASSAAGSV